MQTLNLIIIAAGLAIALLVTAYFICNAILQAFARVATVHATELKGHRDRIAALNEIIRLGRIPETETILTSTDYQTLLQAHTTLILAQMTWRAMPGTESTQRKAPKQALKVIELANRISCTIQPGAAA